MSTEPASRSEAGAGLARGVALILGAGLALGIGFNTLQRASGSEHGLAWIRDPAALARLEDGPARDRPEPGDPAAGVQDPPDIPGAANAGADPEAAAPQRTSAAPVTPAAGHTPPPAPAPRAAAPDSSGRSRAVPDPAAARPGLPEVPESDAPREVSFEIAKRFHDAGAAVFVDARSREEYEDGHIPGAVLLPFDDVFEQPALAERFDPGGKPIITYCSGEECNLSRDLAFALVEGGHRRVLLFKGGAAVWRAEGLSLVTGASPAGQAP